MDSDVKLTGISQAPSSALQVTPCKTTAQPSDFKTPSSCMANRSVLKPPNAFKTPGSEFAATPSTFKTPGTAYKVKMIPTNSALVTDV